MSPRGLRRLVAAAAACLALGAGAAFADTSASIFDYPLPAPQWGYAPAVIHTAPNNWVTWSNEGEDVHTVTAVDGSFDSGELLPSEGFSWFFEAPGTWEYYCTLHEWMRAQVVVTDGPISLPAPEPDPEPFPLPQPEPETE